ncbi:NAD-dependent epimerase/dehydratase [Arenibacter palladensis]|uniref:NAD-dependent epimerase/dehydratase n=1 Tax=Arenibacter palladensis TaxID=237373 RepID=UPI002FCF0C77
MRVILISGINGFLGSYLAKYLSSDYKIIGLANDPENLFRLEHFNFEVSKSTDENIKNILEHNRIFAIIHAATVYDKSEGSVLKLLTTNLMLPIKLYELANKHEVKYFFNTDTFFNIHKTKYTYLSEYSLSKSHVLDWLTTIKNNCILINMKLYHIYGPNDSLTKFVPSIISKIKENTDNIKLTPGDQKRDFIYIEDVCSAYKAVLKNLVPKESINYEFEIGTGISISIQEFVKEVKRITKSTTNFHFGALEYRENEIMDAVANNYELVKLGWKPTISLEEGLIKTILDI